MPTHKITAAELSQALIQFHKEVLGRGPGDVQTLLLADVVFVRCRKVLLNHELGMLQLPDCDRNRQLIKHVHRELMEQHAERLKATVSAIVEAPVLSLHHDLSTTTDECVIVLILGASSL